MGLYDFSALRQMMATQLPAMQQKSWWPSYVQAQQSGDPNQVIAWATYEAPKFADFDGATDGDFVGKQVASMQSGQADRYGINPNVYESAGKVGGTLGALGLAASLGYAGGVGLGALGEGAGAAVGADAVAGGAGTDALAGGAASEGLAGGAAGGTGLTAGTGAATGIGGGATGTGLSAGATGAAGINAGAASGALAPGYFAGETMYPVIGGATAAAGGGLAGISGAGAAGAAGAGLTAADLLRGVPGVLGALAAHEQTGAYTDLANKYLDLGAPSRTRYEASYAPGFTMNMDPGYTDALNQSAKATLHGLSVGGNPADSPNAWAQSLQDLYQKNAYPALQNYRSSNAGAGGLAALTGAAPGASNAAVGSQANVYNALGGAAADIFTPRKSLSDLLRDYR